MVFLEFIKIALTSLRTNKIRSILTMLGVIIGVASVVLLVSIGVGLQSFVTQLFTSLGANTVYVLPGKVDLRRPQSAGGRQVSKFELSDVHDLVRSAKAIKDATPMIEISTTVTFQGNSTVAGTVGVWENYFSINNFTIDRGKLISQNDVERSRKLVVLGAKVVEDLFGSDVDPIGKFLTINEIRYQVVGILESKGGGGLGESIDNHLFIPLSIALNQFDLTRPFGIFIETASEDQVEAAVIQAEEILSRRLKKTDFTVLKQTELLSTIGQFISVATVALSGIASISLLVGGIGIMNIMLVSVTERTREIGLRKAVGATPRDILTQFLIEAVIISLVGGAFGILLGSLGALLLSNLLQIQTTVTLWSIVLAFGFSATVGIIFGVAPAIQAARLDPIEALRYE